MSARTFEERCLSVKEPWISQFEQGTKARCPSHKGCQIEFRTYKAKTGPIVLAASATGGFRAEVRLLADLHECVPLEDGSYEWHLGDMRRVRRDAVKTACLNCRAGVRDTHAGIYRVSVMLVDDAPAKTALRPSKAPGR